MASLPILVLLPPSEGKAEGGKANTKWSVDSGATGNRISASRRAVAAAYVKHGGARVVGAPTLPAYERYTGVVWKHLDLASISAQDRREASKKIFVVSGLLGLVRGDDQIPYYKLKMSARLAPIGSLTKFWLPELTEAVVRLGAKHIIVDLLPNEHRAAIDWSNVSNHMRVDLVAKSGGRVGGHDAKAAKGTLARHILTGDADAAVLMRTFKHPVYRAEIYTPRGK